MLDKGGSKHANFLTGDGEERRHSLFEEGRMPVVKWRSFS